MDKQKVLFITSQTTTVFSLEGLQPPRRPFTVPRDTIKGTPYLHYKSSTNLHVSGQPEISFILYSCLRLGLPAEHFPTKVLK
jgi:hypothetical protein